MRLKKRIAELCFKVAMKEGVKCDAYFNSVGTNRYKVTIRYGHDLYHFKSYRDAIKFLES